MGQGQCCGDGSGAPWWDCIKFVKSHRFVFAERLFSDRVSYKLSQSSLPLQYLQGLFFMRSLSAC